MAGQELQCLGAASWCQHIQECLQYGHSSPRPHFSDGLGAAGWALPPGMCGSGSRELSDCVPGRECRRLELSLGRVATA